MEDMKPRSINRVVTDYDFTEDDLSRLHATLGSDRLVLVHGHDAVAHALQTYPDTDVFCSFHPPANLLALAPALRWLALPSAGADNILQTGIPQQKPDLIVTTANGVHAIPIAEFTFSMMLMWARHWPTLFSYQTHSHWATRPEWAALRGGELHDATLGVLGLGAIGRQVARYGKAFGMRVLATRRTAADAPDPDVDQLVPLDHLDDVLRAADYLVLALPSTRETFHLIDAKQLAQMKRTSFLVNIARGNIVDEAALIAALEQHTIGGAALDVTEHEPLPSDSPLWHMENVILAPHISGSTDRYSARFTDLFLENIRRFERGKPLRNVVDPRRGY